MVKQQNQTFFLLAFTIILLGYLMVWLPGPSAGLQFLGFEMGEWSKFLGVGPKRNWFYLPPLTLSLLLLLFSIGWDKNRIQTWLFRGVAVIVSLLAFPALEDLTGPAQGEYLSRLTGIGLVMIVAACLTLFKAEGQRWGVAGWAGMALAALIGLVWPTIIYLEVRPFAAEIMRVPLGFGPGFVLNIFGHAAVGIMALSQLVGMAKKKYTDQPKPG